MTLAFWCVVIAGILPLVAIGTAKWGLKGYDNHNPRDWLARQTGMRARAVAAERNMFESFAFFAAAVFIAHLSIGPQGTINSLAVIYIVARIVYLVAYLVDLATLRSLVWGVAYLIVLAIATAAAWLG